MLGNIIFFGEMTVFGLTQHGFVNYKTKSIEEQFNIKTNYTNCIEISNKLIKPEIFLTTDKPIPVPISLVV